MKRMFLIDGSNHAFRAHFALPPRHASDGFPTRVLYGFTLLFQKMLRTWKPDYVVVSFDTGKNFRNDIFPDYKGHRPEMPEDLRQQWPYLPQLVEAFGYRCISLPGWEADDVLGTLAKKFGDEDLEIFLVTSDKDFCQLVDDNIRVLDDPKNKIYDEDAVEEKFGVRPDQIIDMLALAGDSSDNIPGITKVGPKTAAKYLKLYDTMEGVLQAAVDGKIKGKTGERLVNEADNARLSFELATIRLDVPIDDELTDLAPREPDAETLRTLFDQWEFGRVARKLLPDQVTVDYSRGSLVSSKDYGKVRDGVRSGVYSSLVPVLSEEGTLSAIAFGGKEGAAVVSVLDAEGGALVSELLSDPKVSLNVYGLKALGRILRQLKGPNSGQLAMFSAAPVTIAADLHDLRLVDYVLAAHRRTHGLADIVSRTLGHTLGSVVNESLTPAQSAAAEQANTLADAAAKLRPKLTDGMAWIYDKVERPLVPILRTMEDEGIALDVEALATVEVDIKQRLAVIREEAYELAGKTFNIRSRHELRDVLFEDLKLPPSKKVKDGWSTASGVLEKLVPLHPLPAKILEYRSLEKLRSTYLTKLPTFRKDDGRIHSTFNQAVTATGRLSSVDPNLQNIPVRTFEGRRIREAFVPAPGCVFLSADYSQVELRVLAHFAQDPVLLESFRSGEDIHTRTAREIFGLGDEEVSLAQRSAAKAINFGLLYGMSAFRLAGDLDISREEASSYMEEYFARMPRVRGWIEETKAQAHKDGAVETLFGRRRIIPEIHSKAFQERSGAEREAVNTRIQGTAADLIKLAMIRVDKALNARSGNAKMLLQVHDEILLEVPVSELDEVKDLVKTEMEAAGALDVPLLVNLSTGDNWNQAHG